MTTTLKPLALSSTFPPARFVVVAADVVELWREVRRRVAHSPVVLDVAEMHVRWDPHGASDHSLAVIASPIETDSEAGLTLWVVVLQHTSWPDHA